MNVHLGETFEQFVADLIRTGEYQSQSEVIREGLRLLKERQELRELRLEQLRKEISVGVEQARCGETAPLDAEAIKREGRRRLQARQRKTSS